jgi:chemotaxis protein histidine kinase CheA
MNSIFTPKTSIFVAMLLALSFNTATAEEVDPTIQALRALDNSVAGNQLDQAESQLQALQKTLPGDTRLEQAQRDISAAYVKQGQAALKSGNLVTASQALGKAQHAMPAGNQQIAALASAIEQNKEQQAATAKAEQQAAAAQAKAAAEKAEQARQQKLVAERKAAEAKKTAETAAAVPAAPVASLIDPAAASSTVAMPMLDEKDNESLRKLLDKVALDVVAFRCKVRIEVRQNKDYPWVAALLSARVKKIDPAFNMQLEQQIDPAKAPQLVLTPQP